MMTPLEKDFLDFIKGSIAERGFSPSYDEFRDHFNLRSKSTVNRVIFQLEQKGRIRRLPGRARAIEPVEMPTTFDPDDLAEYILDACYQVRPSDAFVDRLKEVIRAYAADGNPTKRST